MSGMGGGMSMPGKRAGQNSASNAKTQGGMGSGMSGGWSSNVSSVVSNSPVGTTESDKQKELRRCLAERVSDTELNFLFNYINRIDVTRGAGLIYTNLEGTSILIKRSTRDDSLHCVVREVGSSDTLQSLNANDQESNRLRSELWNVFWSCGSTVLGFLAIAGSTAGTTVTFGASAAALPWVVAGTMASAATCGVSIGRSMNAAVGNDSNKILDASTEYKVVMSVLDGIALASAGQGTIATFQNLRRGGAPLWKTLELAKKKEFLKAMLKEGKLQGQARKEIAELLKMYSVPAIFSKEALMTISKSDLLGKAADVFTVAGSGYSGVINDGSKFTGKVAIGFVEGFKED